MDINKISGIVVDAAVKIHSAIGPGCFERVYEEVLYFELNKRGLYVERQITMLLNMIYW
jgi:GxxExxY protein